MSAEEIATVERDAMVVARGHRAVLAVISALRAYREAVGHALKSRYADGCITGFESSVLADAAEEIERALREDY